MKPKPTPQTPLTRRSMLIGTGSVFAAGMAAATIASTPLHAMQDSATAAASRKFWTAEYTAMRGNVRLAVYRKRMSAPKTGEAPLPVLFLAHGSSLSALSSMDLTVPGKGEYSMMNKFAEFGFDVWAMDFAGYGKSSRIDGNSNVAEGVKDLQALMPLLAKETRQEQFHLYGESSGALRVGVFAMHEPERLRRLVLAAFTYTGEGSVTLANRAKQVDLYRSQNRRPRDREAIRSIFTRDGASVYDPAVAEAMADAELRHGDTAPTGTYLDMTTSMPLVDPAKVRCPVLLVRGEHDGNATEQDLLNFYSKLPNSDRQFVTLANSAHVLPMGRTRAQFWHVVRSFLTMPPAETSGT